MSKLKTSTKKSRGFTLVEILTVVFLGSIIIIASHSIYLISYKSFKKNSASSELTQNARIALERTSREIRQAAEIETDLPIDPGVGTPPSAIEFQDGHDTSKIQYITYYLSGTDLHRELAHYSFALTPDEWVPKSTVVDGNSPEKHSTDEIKAEKISNLQFWGDQTITIRLSVSDGSSTYTFETKTLGRNI